jgi:hypothetical protein
VRQVTLITGYLSNCSLIDYDGLLETVKDYPDILRVMTALRNASAFNHLPAFERSAARG